MNFDNYTLKSQEAIQLAQSLSIEKQNQFIETGHLMKSLMEVNDSSVIYILKKLNINVNQLTNSIDHQIENYPKVQGIQHGQNVSSHFQQSLVHAGSFATQMKDDFITLEHLFLGLLKVNDTTSKMLKESGLVEKDILKICMELRKGGSVSNVSGDSNYKSLEKYARNLNDLARKGKLDPVIGRDEEIRRVLQILSRRTKNNPVLIGEPGVGKTAIAEGLAHRIINGDVPENLKSKVVYSLDMGALVAGAKFKGEFEERLKSVIKEVITSDGEIVLFIDEIHTLVGAGGGGESAMDAANILKPALARGELRAIGATTLHEYQKYIEKDKALERRFQKIYVDEPDTQDTISILRGLKEKYEVHHKVRIKDEAIIAAVELSQRYINDRFLPDKAIDLIDEAAARMRIQIDSLPESLDEVERRIMQLEIEREALKREDNVDRLNSLSKELADLTEERNTIRGKWESEKEIVDKIQTLKENMDNFKTDAENAERLGDYGKVAEIRYGKLKDIEKQILSLNNQLAELQGDNPLIKEEVESEEIASVVSKWTGIPVNRMLQSEREKLLHLEDELHKRVIGQDDAIAAISDSIRRSRAGLSDPKKPIGSFIFLGTTGVGKTELAKALASFMFNQDAAMVRIDMSEYQEKHTVSRLIGAPPGYVGYDEGGQLTEAVRRRPYSVILLDEIEKAHHDVFNILLQVLDDGRLTDNKGRTADFKNTIIIMTSNIGSHIIQENYQDAHESDINSISAKTKLQIMELLRKTIRPEFLNRVDDIIMFEPLTREHVELIVQIQFKQIQDQLASQNITLDATMEALQWIAELGFDPNLGARPLKRVLQKKIVNELSKQILADTIHKDAHILIKLNDSMQLEFVNEN